MYSLLDISEHPMHHAINSFMNNQAVNHLQGISDILDVGVDPAGDGHDLPHIEKSYSVPCFPYSNLAATNPMSNPFPSSFIH